MKTLTTFLPGYFTQVQAEVLCKALESMTCYHIHCTFSNDAGNCKVCISTDNGYDTDTESDLRDAVQYYIESKFIEFVFTKNR